MDTFNPQAIQVLPPTCPVPQNVITNSGSPVHGNINAVDPQGQIITYSINTPPLNGTAFINPETGAWSYSPNQYFAGIDQFAVTATNSSGLSCGTLVTITVQAQAPSCPVPQSYSILAGSSASGTVTASDPQGESLSYSIGTPPINGIAIINAVSGAWNYMPNTGFFGTDSFVVQATNTSGLSCGASMTIQVISPKVAMTKTASTTHIALGSQFNYAISTTNTGNITIANAIITDVLPAELQVANLTLNGAPISGNLSTGVHIGSLAQGATSTLVATLNVLSVSLPSPFYNLANGAFSAIISPGTPPVTISASATETMGVIVDIPNLTLTKMANTSSTAVNETITYTLMARNNGNTKLDHITIVDTLDPNLEFAPGTFAVNSITMPAANIMSGVNIGSLNTGQSATITFDANVIGLGDRTVENTENAWYEYTSDPNAPPNSGSSVSNTVTIPVENPSLQLQKSVNKNLAILDDTLTYTVTITNNGDMNALNVVFKDFFPSAVTLVNGSFTVDGTTINGVDLEQGVSIGNIPANTVQTIQYQVKVVSTNCSGSVINTATASYGYAKMDGGTVYRTESAPASTETNLAIALFKQFSIKNDLIIPCQKPNMEQINDITATIEVTDCYVVESPVGVSNEGQQLTGYKLIVHGFINLIAEYTADVVEQNVHSAMYCIPFSTFIVMPPDFDTSCQSNTKAIVENIYFKQLTSRSFSTNVTLLLIINTR